MIALATLFLAGSFAIDAAKWAEPMAKSHITSLSVAMIRDEEVVEVQDLGLPGRRIYQTGFLSRIPALIAVLQLVDEKKIKLSAPANRYLTSWKIPSAVPAARDVTVKDLLTGQSGFSDYKFVGMDPSQAAPSLLQLLAPLRPASAPGASSQRSATNILILEQLLVDVEKAPFREVAQKRVLKPLGLASTTYAQPLSEELESRVAPGEKPRRLYPQLAAQGMWSTAEDVAKMLGAVMKSARGESKLLSPASARLLFTEVADGATYGLNRGTRDDGHFVFLGGQNDGYSAKVTLSPEEGTGVVVLTNADMGWPVIDGVIGEGLQRVSSLGLGDNVASFEPLWVTGPYAGKTICPVCEYGVLPLAFVWVQNDKDENIATIARGLNQAVLAAAPRKVKAFVVLSNLAGDIEAAKTRASALAKLADTPNVNFVVIRDPDAGPLRSYRINRRSRNDVILAANREVKFAASDFVADSASLLRLQEGFSRLLGGN